MPHPYGPTRLIVDVLKAPDATTLTLDCGHRVSANQIYSYKVGDGRHCWMCRDDAERRLLASAAPEIRADLAFAMGIDCEDDS